MKERYAHASIVLSERRASKSRAPAWVRQTWHTTKLALISCALYVPVSIVMITMAWSSKKYKERHLHGGVPVLVSGVAFLCAFLKPVFVCVGLLVTAWLKN